jgi:hypothetical protein
MRSPFKVVAEKMIRWWCSANVDGKKVMGKQRRDDEYVKEGNRRYDNFAVRRRLKFCFGNSTVLDSKFL